MKRLILTALLALTFAPSAFACDNHLTVSKAWARPSMGGKNMSAAFMDITNNGEKTRTLTGVSVEDAIGEVHTSVEENGVWKMRKLDTLDIAAGSTESLAPKGMHIMLLQQKEALAEGAQTLITLHFADGDNQTVNVPVQKNAP